MRQTGQQRIGEVPLGLGTQQGRTVNAHRAGPERIGGNQVVQPAGHRVGADADVGGHRADVQRVGEVLAQPGQQRADLRLGQRRRAEGIALYDVELRLDDRAEVGAGEMGCHRLGEASAIVIVR